jgi:hypothetical protein
MAADSPLKFVRCACSSSPAAPQVAYHRLCAVLCIKAARSMLAAPVAAASETLAALHPPEPPADPNRAITGSGGTGTSEAAVTAAMDSLTLNAAAAATDGCETPYATRWEMA